jgi:hypothetical protein
MHHLGFVGDAHARLTTSRTLHRQVMAGRTAENDHRRIMSQINAAKHVPVKLQDPYPNIQAQDNEIPVRAAWM